MEGDPVQSGRIREAKAKRRDFLEKHAKKIKVDDPEVDQPAADDPQPDENMGASGSGGVKRKAEDTPEGEPMELMDCVCEDVAVDAVLEEGLEQYEAEGHLEERVHSWADATEEEHADQKTFYDDLTGKPLKPEKVIDARMDEIRALQDMGVWEVVPVAECEQNTHGRPIRGRWVDVNKGDDQVEVYRSRYVAMELKHQYGGAMRDGLFAAMPPLEGMRLLLSHVASRQGGRDPHKLMFIDISKAYLHAEVLSDNIYVELPGEMNMPGMCGKLRRALYGTRQAARAWEEEYTKTLKGAGFQRGKCNPCMYFHSDRDVRVLVHGDDFTVAGSEPELKHVAEVFQSRYKTKVRGILGPDVHDSKAMTILNRIVEWTEAGIQYEADPRHVDLIIEELGLERANGSDVTGTKEEADGDDAELSPAEAYRYRSVAARLNFLAADRVDIQFASKEICRSMSAPRASDWAKVRKLGRYLRRHGRHVLWFEWQSVPTGIQVYVDTDYAGCRRTRRSTNGGLILHGGHLLKTWATTQTVVALSSGEAEYYGVAKGLCEALGIKGIARDMGLDLTIELLTDSSAARGIATRKGLGKVKHLETRTLWVQDKVDAGVVAIKKIGGNDNPADILTKYLSGAKLQSLLGGLPITELGGRHSLAPQLQGKS